MIAQSIGWHSDISPLRLDFYIAYFNTDDYATRISSYEKNMPYIYSMSILYGKNIRFSGMFRWNIEKLFSLSVKLDYTYYSEQENIGSGLEEIEGNKKTDLSVLL